MTRLANVLAVLVAAAVVVAGQGDRGAQALVAPPPVPSRPVQPRFCSGGFSVRKAVLSGSRPPSRLRFQDVLTNLGGWSASESDFEAPCTGVYFFTFHAVSPETSDFTLALMKNGKYQVTAYGSKGNYQQGSNSALLVLNAGEKVHLELQDGSVYEHPYDEAYTTFSAFLVEQF
ncbi:complement C1q-like protein 4 [Penaeus japonicus]|uniref:complement C1q-like protein 4 n=1 Tax=Penaeus japonicus TaxID=27405 RepID=UPI001C70B03D|nr:complement C1q-like protein 4 [Penaeus japonicus]